MRYASLLLFFGILSAGASLADFAFGESAECRIEGHGLTSEQAKAVCDLASVYDVDIAHRESTTLIIVGEHHRAARAHMAAVRALLAQFPYRAVEAFPTEASWANWLEETGQSLVETFAIITGRGTVSLIRETVTHGVTLGFSGTKDEVVWNGNWVRSKRMAEQRLARPTTTRNPFTFTLERDPELISELNRKCFGNEPFWRIRECDDLILNARTRTMVKALPQALTHVPPNQILLVVLGAAHLQGFSQLLECQEGFKVTAAARGFSNGEFGTLLVNGNLCPAK